MKVLPFASLVCLLLVGMGPLRPVGAEELFDEFDVAAEMEVLRSLHRALPEPWVPALREAPLPKAAHGLGPGLAFDEGRLLIQGVQVFDQGPPDGLEVLMTMPGGKNHETLLRLEADQGRTIAAGFLAALDLPEQGQGPPEFSAIPARGWPVQLRLFWQPDLLLEPDRWVWAHASTLVRDRDADRAYPALPYVWTGSRILAIDQSLPDGRVVTTKRLMLEVTRSVAVNFDEPDALLASPFPLASADFLLEVNSRLAPPPDTAVTVVAERAELALTLRLDEAGVLSRADGPALDPAALAELLAQLFGDPQQPELRAYAVEVDPAISRRVDVQARRQLLEAAVQAEVYAVPIFVPAVPD